MGGVENGVSLVLHVPAQITQQPVTHRRVQIGSGFVQDQQPGTAAECHEEGENLLLSFGKLLDLPVRQFKFRPHLLIELLVPPGIEGAYHLMHHPGGEGRDIVGGLAHKAHLFPDRRVSSDVSAQHLDCPRCLGDHPQHRPDQGGFA